MNYVQNSIFIYLKQAVKSSPLKRSIIDLFINESVMGAGSLLFRYFKLIGKVLE
jgi:hypothetical protein